MASIDLYGDPTLDLEEEISNILNGYKGSEGIVVALSWLTLPKSGMY
jgi:hypothetical protein